MDVRISEQLYIHIDHVEYNEKRKRYFIVEHLKSKTRYKFTTDLFQFFQLSLNWIDTTQLIEKLSNEHQIQNDEALNFITDCIEKGLLVIKTDTSILNYQEKYEWLSRNNVYAYILEKYLSKYPYLDCSIPESNKYDKNLMREYSIEKEKPPIYKTYDKVNEIQLPPPTHIQAKEISNLDFISNLLYLSVGKKCEIGIENQGKLLLKNVPSGGARHSIECYLIFTKKNFFFEEGIYHYNVNNHSLDIIELSNINIESSFPNDLDILNSSNVLIILTSLTDRIMWRYREPRTFRVLYIDAGHVMSVLNTFCLTQESDCYKSFDFNLIELSKKIKIDPFSEIITSTFFFSL